jgi:hypothetical protein
MKEKTKKDIYFYIALFGVIGTVVAAIYGYRKDSEIKQIQQRANSPFFVISALQFDLNNISYPEGGKPRYFYNKEPSTLSGQLLDEYVYDDPNIPGDYPDGHPIGLLLKNTGSELRSFEVTSREQIVFQAARTSDAYELRYVYDKASKGRKFRFTITYETADGFQGKQLWEVVKGSASVRRVSPPIP